MNNTQPEQPVVLLFCHENTNLTSVTSSLEDLPRFRIIHLPNPGLILTAGWQTRPASGMFTRAEKHHVR